MEIYLDYYISYNNILHYTFHKITKNEIHLGNVSGIVSPFAS